MNDVEIADSELAKMGISIPAARNKEKEMTWRVEPTEQSRFYSLKQVLQIVPLSRTSIYRMASAGEFPRPRKLGARASCWVKTEVDGWVNDRLQPNT